ncbi:MAG: hypothetical protein LRZ88_00495, partial [Candidatus Cloacimonetes bacterium]|nr:hypothetical protein [Candidatus Cloacimonadota bacterium]
MIGFYPGKLSFYDIAFTHRSASRLDTQGNVVNNERLEYLGDAILGAVIADFLYNRFPQEDEGFLTKMRSKLVNRAILTNLTYEMGLNVLSTPTPTTPSIKAIFTGMSLKPSSGRFIWTADMMLPAILSLNGLSPATLIFTNWNNWIPILKV